MMQCPESPKLVTLGAQKFTYILGFTNVDLRKFLLTLVKFTNVSKLIY